MRGEERTLEGFGRMKALGSRGGCTAHGRALPWNLRDMLAKRACGSRRIWRPALHLASKRSERANQLT